MAISDDSVMWVPMCHAAAQGRVLQSRHVNDLECTVGLLPLVRNGNPLWTWEEDYGFRAGCITFWPAGKPAGTSSILGRVLRTCA